ESRQSTLRRLAGSTVVEYVFNDRYRSFICPVRRFSATHSARFLRRQGPAGDSIRTVTAISDRGSNCPESLGAFLRESRDQTGYPGSYRKVSRRSDFAELQSWNCQQVLAGNQSHSELGQRGGSDRKGSLFVASFEIE